MVKYIILFISIPYLLLLTDVSNICISRVIKMGVSRREKLSK
jgi:hypothetical protein